VHPRRRRGPFLHAREGCRPELPDPSAPPPATKVDTTKDDSESDDDDDAKANEMMKKLLKQGQELLDRQKQK
jgi:hypothetical protein